MASVSLSPALGLSLLLVATHLEGACAGHAIFQDARSPSKSARLNLKATRNVTGVTPEIAYGTNNGLAWKAPVTIGGQTVNLNMDTGSNYPWTFSPALPKNDTAGHSVYDPTKSKTFTNSSDGPFSVAYVGDFGATGYQGFDNFVVGNLSVPDVLFGVATELTGDVVFTGSDGILGLEPFGGQSSPFITAVFKEVEAEILTFDLRNDSTGTLDFGFVDSSLFAPDAKLTTIPLEGSGWLVANVSYAVNGSIPGVKSQFVTLDTGGEVIAVDNATAEAYWAPLVASGSVITTIVGPLNAGTLYVVPCSTALPDLEIIFGDVSSPTETAVISGKTLQQTSWPRGDGSCIGSIWSYPQAWIGAPFFYQYVVAMDYGSLQVTYGPKA